MSKERFATEEMKNAAKDFLEESFHKLEKSEHNIPVLNYLVKNQNHTFSAGKGSMVRRIFVDYHSVAHIERKLSSMATRLYH